MANIYEVVTNALSPLGYPVREQGSYGQDEQLPNTLATYRLISDTNESHADNKPTSTTTTIQVALYSKDPVVIQNADATIKGQMLPVGFMRGQGRRLPLDTDTGHYGYVCDYKYYEMED